MVVEHLEAPFGVFSDPFGIFGVFSGPSACSATMSLKLNKQ